MSLGPQHGSFFHVIRWMTRLQLSAWMRLLGSHQLLMAIFAVMAGALALGTITFAAVLTDLPLLFPPLAPSAFILFTTPMAVQASPRNVIGSHTLAVLAGLFALQLMNMLQPDANLLNPAVMNWSRVVTIALAMATITAMMTAWHCIHPPAAATAMLGAMGYLAEPAQAAGLVGAAILLALEAIILNRLLGGLPYPLWRSCPRLTRQHAALAGLSGHHNTYWHHLAERILQRR
jgi:CBS-domain-containing membrane protein